MLILSVGNALKKQHDVVLRRRFGVEDVRGDPCENSSFKILDVQKILQRYKIIIEFVCRVMQLAKVMPTLFDALVERLRSPPHGRREVSASKDWWKHSSFARGHPVSPAQ